MTGRRPTARSSRRPAASRPRSCPRRSGSACAAECRYEQIRGQDFAKLATLDQEGRSLGDLADLRVSIVRSLMAVRARTWTGEARKLLTFVDNRQDASLQAGHFNDFVQVTQLRGALYRAAGAAERGQDGPAPRRCRHSG